MHNGKGRTLTNMYSYTWDTETGGLLLNSSPLSFSKEPRPVYYKELDILGFDRYWNYAKNDSYPYMWAEANNYFYRGRQVAKTKGGSLYTAPEIVILDAPEPDGIVFIIAGKGAGRRRYNHILSPMYQGRKRQVRGRMQNCDKNIFILSLYIMINEQRPFVNKIWDFSFFDHFKGKYRNGFPWPANCGNQFLPLWH